MGVTQKVHYILAISIDGVSYQIYTNQFNDRHHWTFYLSMFWYIHTKMRHSGEIYGSISVEFFLKYYWHISPLSFSSSPDWIVNHHLIPTQCSSFISHSTLIWVGPLKKAINHIWSKFWAAPNSFYFSIRFDFITNISCTQNISLLHSLWSILPFFERKKSKWNCCSFLIQCIVFVYTLRTPSKKNKKISKSNFKMKIFFKLLSHLYITILGSGEIQPE